MEFSIIIPTFQNYKYCKLTIDSIKKNSSYNHEIIVHLNGNDEQTEKFLIKNDLVYTKSPDNIGLCSGVNLAAKKAQKIISFTLMMICIFCQIGIMLLFRKSKVYRIIIFISL